MRKITLPELTKWGKGKPLGLVIVAEQLAISAEPCFQFLKLIKSGDRIEAFSSLPKAKEWVRLYRNHRQMQKSLIEGLRRFGKNGKFFAELADAILLKRKTMRKVLESMKKRFVKMRPHEQRRFISEAQKEVNRLYSLHLADIESDIKGKVDEEFNRKVKEALNEPEINFYLRVWIPCWFLYRDYPPRLLRRARLGDVKTMDKILRLDASVLNDSRIGENLHQARGKGKSATFERWIEATLRRPKAKITIKKVKYTIAGLISAISEVMGERLSEGKISALFHAVAGDLGREDGDPDIPDRDHSYAFGKAIQRERAFWMPTLRPDKK
jgi:hypothetical protein